MSPEPAAAVTSVLVIAARAVVAICMVLLVVLVVFDAHAERFTAGLAPLQFSGQVEGDLREEYAKLVGVAHNAGDDIGAAHEAAAHGVDAVEIDVTSVGGELHASHDAPVPFFETLFFRRPELEEAWDAPGCATRSYCTSRSPRRRTWRISADSSQRGVTVS